jgi:hypothetical protein
VDDPFRRSPIAQNELSSRADTSSTDATVEGSQDSFTPITWITGIDESGRWNLLNQTSHVSIGASDDDRNVDDLKQAGLACGLSKADGQHLPILGGQAVERDQRFDTLRLV